MSYYPPGFDSNRAVELGKLVDAAYAQFNHRNDSTFCWQPDGYQILSCLSVVEKGVSLPFGYAAAKGADGFIVIRGTQQPLEWLDDAAIIPIPFRAGWGKTTQGFERIYNQLSSEILNAVKILQTRVDFQNLYIAGHSLGAALAHLAAADIFISTQLTATSYTFSGPRTGDPAFASAFDAANLVTWRVFNTEDVVSTLPLAAPDFEPQTHGLNDSVIEMAFKLLLRTGADGLFTHLQTPIPLTFNRGNLADNHNLTNLYTAL